MVSHRAGLRTALCGIPALWQKGEDRPQGYKIHVCRGHNHGHTAQTAAHVRTLARTSPGGSIIDTIVPRRAHHIRRLGHRPLLARQVAGLVLGFLGAAAGNRHIRRRQDPPHCKFGTRRQPRDIPLRLRNGAARIYGVWFKHLVSRSIDYNRPPLGLYHSRHLHAPRRLPRFYRHHRLRRNGWVLFALLIFARCGSRSALLRPHLGPAPRRTAQIIGSVQPSETLFTYLYIRKKLRRDSHKLYSYRYADGRYTVSIANRACVEEAIAAPLPRP